MMHGDLGVRVSVREDTLQHGEGTGRIRAIPTNHNPASAPVLHPTLETGVAAMVMASHAWLAT